jgi:hypothetical protein
MLSPHQALCLLLCFCATAVIGAEPASTGSAAVSGQSNNVIVVADLTLGDYLPQRPECSKPDIVCLNPPPFWINAKVSATVYGKPPPSEFRFTAASHYGKREYKYMEGPQLVLIGKDGIDFYMQRDSRWSLARHKNGELYALTLSSKTVSWLPCETAALREEIFPADFAGEVEEIETKYFPYYRVTTHPSLYVLTPKGAWPRYAISVNRLRDFLEKAGPDIKFACESEE